jgi:exonuclease SbcC
MIPYRLRLRNFMCYREEQCLDFSGMHLACLAGDNGHGKSALLDAMTWALWGRARARRDDELIALGENDMWVEFEFGLGKQRYRVWRQRSRRGRGQSDLHFYIWHGNEDAGEWQILDEGGVLDRQAQIVRALRMEYDTFVNSAFLLQGRADSFTVKTPGERKQILGDILGLARYDQYEEAAKTAVNERKNQVERIHGETSGIDRELDRRPVYETQLNAARAAVMTAGLALRAAEAEQATIRQTLQTAREQARHLDDLRSRLERTRRELAEVQRQAVSARARLAEYEAVLAQRDEIEAGWAALEAARQADAAWNTRLLHYTGLQERLNQARMAVNQARLAVEAEQKRLSDRQIDLARRINAGQAQAATLAQVQEILAGLALKQERRSALVAELREVAERSGSLRSENERLRVEGQSLKDRLAMLSEAEKADCPLCGQPLTTRHRADMLATFAAERDELASRFQKNQGEMKALAERKHALEAEDNDLERELRAVAARQKQAAQAEAAVTDGQAAAAEALQVEVTMAAITARLAARDYAAAEQADLARLEAELAQSGYDSSAHKTVRSRLESLEPVGTRYQRQLLPAIDGVEAARAQVDSLNLQQERRAAELAEDQAQIDRLAEALANLPKLEADERQAGQAVEKAAAEERRARQEEGAAMQQLAVLDTLASRRNQLMSDLDRLNEEISVYNQLREAFGKKGLQAMIIESAIPEVEAEANRLLGRMSEGRMSLRLETQREKVTGGLAETLDIMISDELGARSYETYSGGEAFRANLALRIAISKLLARRAGAQLQTLVIDEGFGTQDAMGRSLVVEAISSIQHDFERILVITHVEELKDLFPARIDVVKTANGSRIVVT